jgi:D-lyxose ketol-isomerase
MESYRRSERTKENMMKRSEVNSVLREASVLFETMKFNLPPWACYSTEQWMEILNDPNKAEAHAEIIDNQLGWDLTDFGSGDYASIGLLLFTLRNGNPRDPGGKPYAEKVLVSGENQVTPMHFHWSKMEDIIVRGGGNLQVKLYNAAHTTDPASEPAPPVDESGDVHVSIDGVTNVFPAGTTVTLEPGQSITLTPYMYHAFWAESGSGTVLAGEVSMVNDDERDNCFLDAPGRFPDIEEDAQPWVLLCTEYRKAQRYVG